VRTIPFFSAKRLVVIRDFDSLPREDISRLVEYLINPPSHTCVVIDVLDESALRVYKQSIKHVKLLRFEALTDAGLSAWIKNVALSLGKTIESEAIEMLKELAGHDMLALSQEMSKLVTFVGVKAVISSGDVDLMVGNSSSVSAFELTWAIGDRSVERAMNLVRKLIMSGKNHNEIVGLLSWHMKRLLKVKRLLAAGQTEQAISYMLKVPRRYHQDLFRQAGAFSLAGIRSKIAILLETDLDLKRTRFDPTCIIEFGIIRLCLFEDVSLFVRRAILREAVFL